VPEGNRDDTLQRGDIIVAVNGRSRVELDLNEWAWAFASIQQMGSTEIHLEVIRNNQRLTLLLKWKEDKTWPLEDRGLILARDIRVQKADNLLDAFGLGLDDVGKSLGQLVTNLRGAVTGRIATTNLGGPVLITRAAYRIADYDLFEFIFFLALISLNFSVINLLPIPVLDGGEVLLLIVEKLNGKPLAALARPIAYGVGLTLLSFWMLFSVVIDLQR
jgi:regulator of sigma E protease